MKIAVTGATGFLGHYITRRLVEAGHRCRAWYREGSDRGGFEDISRSIEWLPGELGNETDSRALVEGCDAVVHGALYHPGGGFRTGAGELLPFLERNVLGSIRLIEASRAAGANRFVFISSCAVHEKILGDRPLDETHPTYAKSHYGAHKAAIEQFVYSYGLGHDYPICALRPSGIYGLARPANESKWFNLVRKVVQGQAVECRRGGKEVHAADVAQAVELLLAADNIAGEVFSCCDRYIADYHVATLARQIAGTKTEIRGEASQPKNLIVTDKLQRLGMRFGGESRLRDTVAELVQAVS